MTTIKTHHNEQKLRFYGDEFIFNTISGMFYRVTPSAGFLLRHIVQGATEVELIELMQKEYGTDRTTAMRDVELLLNNLIELGVVETEQYGNQASIPIKRS